VDEVLGALASSTSERSTTEACVRWTERS